MSLSSTPSKMSSILLKRVLLPRATTNHHPFHLIFYTTHTLSPHSPDDTTVTTAVEILTHHRSKSRWSTLLSLLPHNLTLTPSQISQITLHIRNNPHLALRFFHFTTQHFPSTNSSLLSYATIIHILARSRQKTQAQTLIKEALRGNTSQSCDLFKVLVETYRVCDSAPFVFDLLVKSLLEMGKLDPCVEIVRKLKSRGCYVSVGTCNALVLSVSKRKGCFFGYDLFKEVFGCGCRVLPNVHTFNGLMLSFSRSGVIDMVEEVWIEMVKWKCSANCFSFCILMEAYCEDGDVEKARNVWEEMRLTGLEVDVVAYNTMIGGYCKTAEVEKGEELYREMVVSGVEGDCVTYQHLVNGYCLIGDAENAMLLCKDMRRKGYCPDSCTVDAMVSVLCEKNCVMEALGIFRNVVDNADFVARETSYEVMIKGLCGVGKMEEALKLQAQMVGKGFRPNVEIYGAFIDGYMKLGKPEVAENLRKEIMEMEH